MIELVFVVCLSAEPTVCERRSLQFSDLTTTSCVMGAQPQLAQWAGTHPGWLIQRWTCQPLGGSQDV